MNKKRHFRITIYGAAVLIVLLIVALAGGKKNSGSGILFDKHSPITLYAKTTEGVKPDLSRTVYFPESKLDPAKFSYDWSGCDLNTPGTYQLPVYYDGKKTVCILSLTVTSADETDSLDALRQTIGEGKGDGTQIGNTPKGDDTQTEPLQEGGGQ